MPLVECIDIVMGGMLIVVQGALTGPLTKRFGEAFLIRIGLIGGALGFLAMSLARGYGTDSRRFSSEIFKSV